MIAQQAEQFVRLVERTLYLIELFETLYLDTTRAYDEEFANKERQTPTFDACLSSSCVILQTYFNYYIDLISYLAGQWSPRLIS